MEARATSAKRIPWYLHEQKTTKPEKKHCRHLMLNHEAWLWDTTPDLVLNIINVMETGAGINQMSNSDGHES